MTEDEIMSLWNEHADGMNGDTLMRFANAVAAKAASEEREAIEALHEHEDVQAPIGNSSWGEAYQEGWAQGTAAYRAAIRARGQA